MTDPRRSVLVVEDESAQRTMYERAITRMGFHVSTAASLEDARARLEEEHPAVVLLDLNLAGESGMDFFEHVRETAPAVSVVISTGYGTLEVAQRAIRMDVADFLTKPVELADLEAALERAWDRHVLVQSPVRELVPPTGDEENRDDHERSLRDRKSLNIDEAERHLIIEALTRCNDNRKAAAKLLGISERKLYYRLSQFSSRT